MSYSIRKARKEDVSPLFGLMTELARFENYIHRFAVTEEVVLESGFVKDPPDFVALVAESDETGDLIGMAVTYRIPYTSYARPMLVLKELYVVEQARSAGVGAALMREVARLAIEQNCVAVRWQVAPWNDPGIRFYERLGAVEDTDWLDYYFDEETFVRLADSSTSEDASA